MKAITLRHPWAFAVQRLGKTVENRTWEPPRHLIGQYIAIHGGAVPKGEARVECEAEAEYILTEILTMEGMALLSEARQNWLYHQAHTISVKDWIIPGIVAVAKLEVAVTKSDSPWFFGPYGWVLSDVTPLETPIPHRGAQGFWPVSAAALAQIEAQI